MERGTCAIGWLHDHPAIVVLCSRGKSSGCRVQQASTVALLRLVEGTVYHVCSTRPPRSWGSISLQETKSLHVEFAPCGRYFGLRHGPSIGSLAPHHASRLVLGPGLVASCWGHDEVTRAWQKAELKVEMSTRWEMAGSLSRCKEEEQGWVLVGVERGVWAAASSPEAHSRARARARAAELGPQAAAVGWAGWRNWDQDGKKASQFRLLHRPRFPPSLSLQGQARRESKHQTPSSSPPRCLPRTLNLPTIASSARHRSSSPRRSPNRDNFSAAAEAFGPTHPPPPSSASPNRLLLSPPPRSRSRQHPQQQHIVFSPMPGQHRL